MDPLSALRMMVSPELKAKLTGAADPTVAQQAIPAAELQKLSVADKTNSVTAPAQGGSFQSMLGNFVQDVSSKQADASQAVSGLLSGQNVSLHQAMVKMEEASVSFQMMVEVRNKLVDSYQELMRMQV